MLRTIPLDIGNTRFWYMKEQKSCSENEKKKQIHEWFPDQRTGHMNENFISTPPGGMFLNSSLAHVKIKLLCANLMVQSARI